MGRKVVGNGNAGNERELKMDDTAMGRCGDRRDGDRRDGDNGETAKGKSKTKDSEEDNSKVVLNRL
jgi:hypothetical protein